MKKLAVLRSNVENTCPFGLSIPFGCKNAGTLIHRLERTTDPEVAKSNQSKIENSPEKAPCDYASNIIEDKLVACEAPSVEESFPKGSPMFYRPMGGVGLEGLNTVPMGYYNDNSLDRGYYYGMYSVESIAEIKKKYDNLIKKAGLLKFPQETYKQMLDFVLSGVSYKLLHQIEHLLLKNESIQDYDHYIDQLLNDEYFILIDSGEIKHTIDKILQYFESNQRLNIKIYAGDLNGINKYNVGLFIFKLNNEKFNYSALGHPLEKEISYKKLVQNLKRDLPKLYEKAWEFKDLSHDLASPLSKKSFIEYKLVQEFLKKFNPQPVLEQFFEVPLSNIVKNEYADSLIEVKLVFSEAAKTLIYNKESWQGLHFDDKIYIYIDEKYNADSIDSVKNLFHRIGNTLRHELQHVVQMDTKENEVIGLPSNKIRSPNYNIHGTPLNKGDKDFQDHNLRDIEFYTDLTDNIMKLKSALINIPPSLRQIAFKYALGQTKSTDFIKDISIYMGANRIHAFNNQRLTNILEIPRNYFENLKNNNFGKYQKAVKEAYKAISNEFNIEASIRSQYNQIIKLTRRD